MFYAFRGSKTLVISTFFIMILTWDIQKHWQAPKKNKKHQTTRCTKHRQAQKKNSNYSEVDPGFLEHFLEHLVVFFWCLRRFGASSGLFFCVFFWCLCRLGDSDFTKHWQTPKKQKNKPLDAPNIDRHQKTKKNPATTQKWTHSSWKFDFFCFFWCLCRFGASSVYFIFCACAGLVTLTSQNIGKHQ